MIFSCRISRQERRAAGPLHYMWFEPTKLGTSLVLAQYCGAFHAGMIGSSLW